MAGSTPYLAPLDGDHRGTWLAANGMGVTVGLLNRYRVPGYQPPQFPRSRGLLVLDLIDLPDLERIAARLSRLSFADVQPFTLVMVEPGSLVRLAEWDGSTLHRWTHGAPGLVLTSSSVTEPEVAMARAQVFREAPTLTPETLAQIHRSHLPERGKASICMHREDAETQSFSRVTVTSHDIHFEHTPGAPCRTLPLAPLILARRTAPTAA